MSFKDFLKTKLGKATIIASGLGVVGLGGWGVYELHQHLTKDSKEPQTEEVVPTGKVVTEHVKPSVPAAEKPKSAVNAILSDLGIEATSAEDYSAKPDTAKDYETKSAAETKPVAANDILSDLGIETSETKTSETKTSEIKTSEIKTSAPKKYEAPKTIEEKIPEPVKEKTPEPVSKIIINPRTGRPFGDLESIGLGEYKKAQEKRDEQFKQGKKPGDIFLGWDSYYDSIDDNFGTRIGEDGFRFTARVKGYALSEMWKIGEAVRVECEPFKKLRGKDAFRLDLLLKNTNAGYEWGLYADEQKARLGVTKFWDLGDALFMTGIDYGVTDWASNGKNAPDSIIVPETGFKAGIKVPSIGMTLSARYALLKGDYEIFSLERAMDGSDLYLALKFDIPDSKVFLGAEYQFTENDFEQAMLTKDNRITAFAGLKNTAIADILTLGITNNDRNNNVGEDYNRWNAELRARWALDNKKRTWIRGYLLGGESLPGSDDKLMYGFGIDFGVSF